MNKIFYLILLLTLIGCKKHKLGESKPHGDSISRVKNEQVNSQPDSIDLPITVSKTSQPFEINKVKYYWDFTAIIVPRRDSGEGTLVLKNAKTGKIALTDIDIYPMGKFEKFSFEENNKNNFKDVNFDGYKDFTAYSDDKTGQGGDIYNVYLYDKKSQSFIYSEELEGGLEIDSVKKTVSSFWHAGATISANAVHHFENGKIKFTEVFSSEFIEEDIEIQTYKKIIGKKEVITKIDTVRQ